MTEVGMANSSVMFFEPGRPGAGQHPSRTCSQTCCVANRSEKI
jgi:hypothetical protein